ncbi:uncharacterized protein LOC135397813 [Ornithodoros turicata]|uniref:uncharacterized protein LOC135397813 n=1 Tax=Ornithodoros turicata TaxID=34597 RepID=UPI003138A98A
MRSNQDSSISAPCTLPARLEERRMKSRKSCGDAGKSSHSEGSPKRKKGLKNFFWGSSRGSHSSKSRKELIKEIIQLKRENAKLEQECTYTKLIYSELKQERLVEMERTSKGRARRKRILAAKLAAVQNIGGRVINPQKRNTDSTDSSFGIQEGSLHYDETSLREVKPGEPANCLKKSQSHEPSQHPRSQNARKGTSSRNQSFVRIKHPSKKIIMVTAERKSPEDISDIDYEHEGMIIRKSTGRSREKISVTSVHSSDSMKSDKINGAGMVIDSTAGDHTELTHARKAHMESTLATSEAVLREKADSHLQRPTYRFDTKPHDRRTKRHDLKSNTTVIDKGSSAVVEDSTVEVKSALPSDVQISSKSDTEPLQREICASEEKQKIEVRISEEASLGKSRSASKSLVAKRLGESRTADATPPCSGADKMCFSQPLTANSLRSSRSVGVEKTAASQLSVSRIAFLNRRIFSSKTMDDLTTSKIGSSLHRRIASDTTPRVAGSIVNKAKGGDEVREKQIIGMKAVMSELKQRIGSAESPICARSIYKSLEVREISLCRPTKDVATKKCKDPEEPELSTSHVAMTVGSMQDLEVTLTVTAYSNDGKPVSVSTKEPDATVSPDSTGVNEDTSPISTVMSGDVQLHDAKQERKKKGKGKKHKHRAAKDSSTDTSGKVERHKGKKDAPSKATKLDAAASGSRPAPCEDESTRTLNVTVPSDAAASASGYVPVLDTNANTFPVAVASDSNGNNTQTSVVPENRHETTAQVQPECSRTANRKSRALFETGSSKSTCLRRTPSPAASPVDEYGEPSKKRLASKKIVGDSSGVVGRKFLQESAEHDVHASRASDKQEPALKNYGCSVKSAPNPAALFPPGKELIDEGQDGRRLEQGSTQNRGLLPPYAVVEDAARVDNITASSLNLDQHGGQSPRHKRLPVASRQLPSSSNITESSTRERDSSTSTRQRPAAPQVDTRPVSWEEVQSCLLPAFYKFSDTGTTHAKPSKSVYDLGETI